MNEWQTLRSRYKSQRAYQRRRVIKSQTDLQDFSDFVVDQGADISAQPFENETLRFKFNGVFGIVWTSGTGNLLAHDFGNKFYKEASV
ncbi:hypothetical protein [uncultured Acinetobacter sp.]|uniref:hypothetical protein n=1 Tax=uncultured Acinetobacter sp. TaxID=165433 RepID=UPI0025E3B282|nr:hypothetical protein [uncultured Acinetobacter sp.]